MKSVAMLTGVGHDRVGIVAALTEELFSAGCNILDSSMTLLRSEFAIILMVQLPENLTLEQLQERLESVSKSIDFTVHARLLSDDELEEEPEPGTMHMISVYGADRPGIVSGITRKLADLGVNITDVETKYTGSAIKSASAEEEHVFVMLLEVIAPDDLDGQALESALKAASGSAGVDITVQTLEVVEL